MNAKWVGHLLLYRDSLYRIQAVQTILHQKFERQKALLKKYKHSIHIPTIFSEQSIPKLFLIEARYARVYWKSFSKLLPLWCFWKGRLPHSDDTVNKLLDIGYHTLALTIQKKCKALDIPTEIGLLHTAQSAKAHPLVYDVMECFRVLMVDEVLLKFLHMKKRPIEVVDKSVVNDFLHDVYMVLHREYYHRGRGTCISFSYWIDLILLELRNSVSEKRDFRPHWMPVRHESRCNKKPPRNTEE